MQDLNKFKNEMNLSGQNVYVGHRYVPKLMGEWDNTKTYESLSIVQYKGNSFTSRQNVPIGIEITNEEFWVSTGNYNAQIENYRREVSENNTKVENYHQEIFNSLTDIDGNTYETLTGRLQNFDNKFKDVNIFRNVLDYNVKNDGTNTEQALNDLEGGYTYIFPTGEYGVKGYSAGESETGFKLKSNTRYIFMKGAKIKILDNNSPQYSGILIKNAENFELINAEVVGDRDNHDFTSGGSHERGAGVMIRENASGVIHNLKVSNTTGDGIDVIGNNKTNIEFTGSTIVDNARRNGVSLESGHRIIFDVLEIANIKGTSPESGIDFEPFKDGHILDYVFINHLKTENNNKVGIHFAAMQWYKTPVNIVINHAEVDGIDFVNLWDTGNENIKIDIYNPKITSRGIILQDSWAYKTTIHNPTILSDDGITLSSSNYTGTNSMVGGLKINNADVTGNNVVKFNFTNMAHTKGMQDIDIDVLKYKANKTIEMGLSTNYAAKLNDVNIKVENIETHIPKGTSQVDFLIGKKVTNEGATKREFYYIQAIQNKLKGYIEFEVVENQEMFISTGALSTGRFINPGKATSIKSSTIGSYLKLENVGQKYGSETGVDEWRIVEQIGDWEMVYE